MIGERIKELRESANMSFEAFGQIADTSKQYVSGLEKGRIKRPNGVFLESWARHFRVNMRWLAEGKGPKDAGSSDDDADWPPIRATTQRLGLGGSAAVEEYADAHKLKFRAASLHRKGLHPDKCEVAYGKGDSMLPRIHDGDAILFNRAQVEPVNRKLFVIEVDGITGQYEPQVKRCRIIGGQVFFEALNPDGDHHWNEPRPMIDKRHPIRILGQVRWIGSWED